MDALATGTCSNDKYLTQGFAQSPFYGGNSEVRPERRNTILQTRQFICNINRHQIPPGRQHLPEFDKNGAQPFQGFTQTLPSGGLQIASY
jgi:hypothetical protein